MDFWATLDHDMQYKKQVEDSEAIMRELRECADVIHQTDEKMMRLRERIHRVIRNKAAGKFNKKQNIVDNSA